MSTSLTDAEKQNIIEVYELLFNDSFLQNHKQQINLLTLQALEDALVALEACNASIKELLTRLVGVAVKGQKGWLRWVLKALAMAMKADKHRFSWVGCSNMIAWQRKSQIRSSLW